MTCPICRSRKFAKKDLELEAKVRGETFLVAMKGLSCDQCGYQTVDGPQTGEFMKRAADAYRAKHQLLTSLEISTKRKAKGWSQQDLSHWLKVGIASVKRWENSGIQDSAMDLLLRLHLDAAFAERHMREIHKIKGPTHKICYQPQLPPEIFSRGQVTSLAYRESWPMNEIPTGRPDGAK